MTRAPHQSRSAAYWIFAVSLSVIALAVAATLVLIDASYAQARAAAEREMVLTAASAAREADRYLDDEVRKLVALSSIPALPREEIGRMQEYFDGLVRAGAVTEIRWIGLNGAVRVRSGGSPPRDVDLSDRDYVRQALQTHGPAIGAAVVDRVSDTPAVPIAYPTYTQNGTPSGVLSIQLHLDGTRAGQLAFASVPSLRVLDSTGHLLISDGSGTDLQDRSRWSGFAGVLGAPGIRHGDGVLGEPDRVVAHARSREAGWVLAVDRPASEVYAEAAARRRLELALLAGIALVAIAGSSLAACVAQRGARRVARLEQAAADAQRSRDDLVRSLTHDIANPLTVMQAHVTRLSRRAETGDEATLRGLREIRGASQRIERMLNELSDVHEAQVDLHVEDIDLVERMHALIEEQAGVDPSHRYVLDAPGPEGTRPRLLGRWDGERLERMIGNLLSNAAKYSPAGSEIHVRLRRLDRSGMPEAVIEVEDHGVGIPSGELPHVFDPYYRASNAVATGQRGRGIGLASVRQVVEQHGGAVHIRSVEGSGTTVSVALPLGAAGLGESSPNEPRDEEVAVGTAQPGADSNSRAAR